MEFSIAMFGKPLRVITSVAALTMGAAPAFAQSTDFDGDLIDMIPSLYGGNGLILCPADSCRHGGHFTFDSLEKFNSLALSVRDLTFPTINAKVGAQFKYDPVLDSFVPSISSAGSSIFALDADTIGRGDFYVGLAYSTRSFETLDGQELDALTVDLRHIDSGLDGPDLPCIGGAPGACYMFERDTVRLALDINLKEEMFLTTFSYGISENFDVTLLAPLLRTQMSVSSTATIIENPTRDFVNFTLHAFGEGSFGPTDFLATSRTGFGDLVLRFNHWRHQGDANGWDLSLVADIRLPTGKQRNFQGLPNIGLHPRIVASKTMSVGSGFFRPHVNLGYGVHTGPNKEHQLDYTLGASYTLALGGNSGSLALSADFLGRHVVHKKDGMGDNTYDLSIGSKYSFQNGVGLFYSILLPLNQQGLRPSAQHIFGAQVRF
jgi:hypothetical protein